MAAKNQSKMTKSGRIFVKQLQVAPKIGRKLEEVA
jgi:hypothetical protein